MLWNNLRSHYYGKAKVMLNTDCNAFKVSKIVFDWCLYVNCHLMNHKYNEYVLWRNLGW